jgi:hypothetical protein
VVGVLHAEIRSHLANARRARAIIAAAQNQYKKRKESNQSHKARISDWTLGGGRFSVHNGVRGDSLPHKVEGRVHWRKY